MLKTALWVDVFQKAKRLKDSGHVVIQRNGYDNVVALVRGDNGIYEVEFQRQDPNSRAISMWSCTCPWAQFVWFRSRPWHKYEGRVCSHCLAAYWQAKATPLDDDALEAYEEGVDELGQKLDEELPGGDEGPPEGPGGEMMDMIDSGEAEELPDETDETMPTELPIEPDLTQGPIPSAPELPFPAPGEEPPAAPTLAPGLAPGNNIQQGLQELQKQLGPTQFNFLQQKFPEFFKMPGTFSSASSDFDAIFEMLYPTTPGKQSQTPTAKMLKPEHGEMRGGVNPHPEAKPNGKRRDGTPLYAMEDMGWHPEEQIMYTVDRSHLTPERRGDYGEIPAGATVSVFDADQTTGWVRVQWPLPEFAYCQAEYIDAWVSAKDLQLIGSGRMTPFVKRHGPAPKEEADWQTSEPIEDWA